ncbi:DEAD/DEAH box helicase [Paracerasibacillus soli]|uniref:DEAD/DEAH box helicase family protein n=1 Tax=Paracerasibacillus soli TaxID=480284 RepID=A0ABU5CTU0_9BACI|nr:DEAD/DEAH box helicase [Virgibacillus soli]MDY0409791.1 DEAD/DEAH box helicase family protein [Virgibacillus soli]
MNFLSKAMEEFGVEKKKKVIDPVKIFYEELIQKPTYNFLRDNQTEFLRKWDRKREDKDIVGIMETGSGKTLLGLLMLYSKLLEGVGPVVYFCPDNQLVEQVCAQAALYGIPTCIVEKVEGSRREFPLEFINQEKILVATFEQLFNGQSIFGIRNSMRREIQDIGALVIDDAHDCVIKARKKATVEITRSGNETLYNEILALFEEELRYQGEGAFNNIQKREYSVILQVPSWAWENKLTMVKKLLADNNNDGNPNIFFNLPLINDCLSLCDCYVSGGKIEITPISIPVESVPSYKNAKHRYILSATLGNSYELISDLDISEETLKNPITVDNTQLGERLILTPKRYKTEFNDDIMRKQCLIWAERKNINVVVIVPNDSIAQKWSKIGAKLVTSNNIQESLQQLRDSEGNVLVFMNRYDGIDLINDMCRILVLDGMPTKESLKDKIEMQYREDSTYLNLKRAQIIEQGMGRGVRSGTDHCITFLLGNDLLSFIGKNQNKKLFSPSVQAQIDFGMSLIRENNMSVKEVAVAINSAMDTCLAADEKWRKFHKELVSNASEKYKKVQLDDYIGVASLLRKATRYSSRRDEQNVNVCMNEIVKKVTDTADEGWFYQLYSNLISTINKVRAQELQLKAYDLNSALKPLTFVKSKKVKKCSSQVENFKERLKEYSTANDIVIALDEITSQLLYSPSHDYQIFEKAVKDLGYFLGFISEQPDKKSDGQDNFWRTENFDFVIECKNQSTGEVSRSETSQIASSKRWYTDLYAEENRLCLVMFHPESILRRDAYGDSEFNVVNKEKLTHLREKVRALGEKLSVKGSNEWTVGELQDRLSNCRLDQKLFLQEFTSKIRRQR